jgi:hypothetical protein
MSRPVLSCRECDRAFRLRHGTAAQAVRAGRLPHTRRGRWMLVPAAFAAKLFAGAACAS